MRTLRTVVLVAVALAFLTGCRSGGVLVPWPVPPPVPVDPAPPPGPVDPLPPPPPIPTPTPPPATVSGALSKIVEGMTLAQVSEAMGRSPDVVVPASAGAPSSARWFLDVEDAQRFMVFAVLVDGKVAAKGSARVEVVP